MTATVLIRWTVFLEKIQTAFDDLMAEATVGCLAVLKENKLDPTAMSNAWSGIRAEVFALTERIESTWRERVEQALVDAGAAPLELRAQEERGRQLSRQLMFEFERTEIEVYADAAQLVLEAATATLQRSFGCTQCGAQLPIPSKAFRSVHVPCQYCSSVNTFEPGNEVRMVEHFCAHHLSQRSALEAWQQLKHAERRWRDTRGETPEVLEALEAATYTYWETYLRARNALLPELEKDFQRDLEGKLRAFKLAHP